MNRTFQLEIATPEKEFFTGPVDSLVISTIDGEMGVLAGHVPAVVALSSGAMRMKTKDGWREAAVIGGFARINPEYVIVFADTAEWPEDIEESRALDAKHRAEERLQVRQSEIEYVRSRVALERALARLTVKNDRKFDD